jgi:hypothetical protein
MRHVFLFSLLSFGLAASSLAQVPQMSTVQPGNGTVGSVLKVHGLYLGKEKVDEVYLTDHTFDMMVKVLNQTEDSIEFRIPPAAKPGRLQLLVKTTGKKPILLEQPVFVTVEEKDLPQAEVATASK